MTFLSPLYLFGLLAIALPIAIHLLSKPRLQRIRWAATKFLLASIQKNRSRILIEDLLLLVLRCLLTALLVLIFARPAWLVSALGLDVNGGASCSVIVLDDSASMGQSDGTQSRFDQAKTMVDGILSKMGSGSECALYVVSDRAKALIARPTKDFTVIRRTLAQTDLTDGSSNLLPGLQAAVEVLKTSTQTKKDVYLLTDSQLSAWKELGAIRQLQQDHPDITFHFAIVGTHGEDNLAVTGIHLTGTLVAINQPIRCTVQISNWGKASVSNLSVKLSTDNDPPIDEGIITKIDPGAAQSITLTARFRQPGYHSITATIPGDRLPADNQRSLAVQVLEEIRVLIVEGSHSTDPVSGEGFFLHYALLPVRPDQMESYPVKVTLGAPGDLERSTLNQNELIFLTNISQLTPVGAKNLKEYVNQGGALAVFPGTATDQSYYNTDPSFSPLLPAQLGKDVDAPGDKKTLNWQSKDYDHPITQLWNDPASGNLGTVQVTHYFPLSVKAPSKDGQAPPRIVVNYSDSEPAVVEQAVGKGKVFLFSSTATTAWTNLPLQPAFVPLLIRLTSYVTSGLSGKVNLAPAEAFSMELDSDYANKDLFVESPGEKKHSAGRIEQGDHSAVIGYSNTDRAGVYRLSVSDEPKPKVVFAVQTDPSESNLTQESADALLPLMKSNQAQTPDANTSSAEKSRGSLVPGEEFWYALAIAALCFVIIETFAAHFFSFSK